MMRELFQALLLIGIGIGAASTINLLFDWRRNRALDKWMEAPRSLPACALAGSVRPGRRA